MREAHDELVVLLPQELLLIAEAARIGSCWFEPKIGLQEPTAARHMLVWAGGGLRLLDLQMERAAQ